MKKLITTIIILSFAYLAKSQTIEKVDFKYLDEKIIVYYDIVDCGYGYNKYEIAIRFEDINGKVIIPQGNMTGDYGIVSCGKNKKVTWDFLQELDRFEGNFKVIVSIRNILNFNGKVVESNPKKFRIVKYKIVDNLIHVTLNRGLNKKIIIGDLFFVGTNDESINLNGKRINKIGCIKIAEVKSDTSSGLLTLRNTIDFESISKKPNNSYLYKYKKLKFYPSIIYSSFNERTGFLGYGLGLELTNKKNTSSFGFELFNLYLNDKEFKKTFFGFDLNLFYSITPYCLNSKILSIILEAHPLSVNNTKSYDDLSTKITLKERIGIALSLDFNRFRLKSGLLLGKSESFYHYNNGLNKTLLRSTSFYFSLSYLIN